MREKEVWERSRRGWWGGEGAQDGEGSQDGEEASHSHRLAGSAPQQVGGQYRGQLPLQ